MLCPFLQESKDRGFIHQCSDLDTLNALMSSGESVSAYIGFDATAPSLQVGNLVAIMWLRLLQKHGIRPLVLLGGGTTMVGDPSGKDESRKMLDEAAINANLEKFRETFARYLRFGEEKADALILDNAAWLTGLNYIEFLRDFGPHFTINRMLTMDSVRLRLEREQPLTFLEFNYMILQAYDYLHLNRKYGCRLQMGGSDQWGNIINGVELIRRVDGKQAFALTAPLLTTASGAKMGKSAKGAVWLRAESLVPYDYWQFWRNTEDADVIRFMKIFTDLPLEEINAYAKLEGAAINEAKIRLADEATALAHGGEILESIHKQASAFFAGAGSADIEVKELAGPWPMRLDTLVCEAGLAQSKSEARRLVEGKAVSLGGIVQGDFAAMIEAPSAPVKLSAGKKRHAMVKAGT